MAGWQLQKRNVSSREMQCAGRVSRCKIYQEVNTRKKIKEAGNHVSLLLIQSSWTASSFPRYGKDQKGSSTSINVLHTTPDYLQLLVDGRFVHTEILVPTCSHSSLDSNMINSGYVHTLGEWLITWQASFWLWYLSQMACSNKPPKFSLQCRKALYLCTRILMYFAMKLSLHQLDGGEASHMVLGVDERSDTVYKGSPNPQLESACAYAYQTLTGNAVDIVKWVHPPLAGAKC